MKLILASLLLFPVIFACAQKRGATQHDLDSLPGYWTGSITFTDYSDDHTKQSLPALLIITSKTDSLALDYSYTQTNGKIVANKGDLRIYNEGTNLQLDGIEYVIVAVRREGPRLTIIAERDGTDNNKEATIRQTFIIGPGILNITKEVKYETQEKFFVRTYMRLRK